MYLKSGGEGGGGFNVSVGKWDKINHSNWDVPAEIRMVGQSATLCVTGNKHP